MPAIPVTVATPAVPTTHPGSAPANALRGIALMAVGMFMFSAGDAGAKFLTETLPPLQIVWFRQLGLLCGVFVMLGLRGTEILRTEHPRLQLLRGSLAAMSATLFVTAVQFVPLADAVAVSFVAPFMVTLMGALVLREKVGIRRWSAVIIGFLGAMIVIRPGTGALHPAAFLVIIAAGLFALRQILSRALARSDRTVTTVAYTALVGSALLTVPLPFVWVTPHTAPVIAALVMIGVLAACAEILVIKSLEITEAVVVAPVQYTLLIWGTFYGWAIFGQLPDGWTWTGALIIVATGIYTLQRERLAHRG